MGHVGQLRRLFHVLQAAWHAARGPALTVLPHVCLCHAGGKFALPDEAEAGEGGPEEQLTHLGRSLAEMNDVGEVG